jgi:hypothetical protein
MAAAFLGMALPLAANCRFRQIWHFVKPYTNG